MAAFDFSDLLEDFSNYLSFYMGAFLFKIQFPRGHNKKTWKYFSYEEMTSQNREREISIVDPPCFYAWAFYWAISMVFDNL